MSRITVAVALGLSILATGCKVDPDANRQLADNHTIQPGTYELLAVRNGKADHSDLLMPSRPVEDYFKSEYGDAYLGMMIKRLRPSQGGGSIRTLDYPCKVTSFTPDGGAFTASANCQYLPHGTRTDYEISGRNYTDGFVIDVVQSGYGTANEGAPDQIQVRADKRPA